METPSKNATVAIVDVGGNKIILGLPKTAEDALFLAQKLEQTDQIIDQAASKQGLELRGRQRYFVTQATPNGLVEVKPLDQLYRS